MDARELKFLNAFLSIPGVGRATVRALKERFGSFATAWESDASRYAGAPLDGQAREAILWKKPSTNPDALFRALVSEGIWMIGEDDPEYPSLLKTIGEPPVALYGRGKFPEYSFAVGIVGTRKPTGYGLEAAGSIAGGLAAAGVVVVSGLAFGIDARAHEAALEAGGLTIAVIGSGVDRESMYPPENRTLVRRIVDGKGAVVTEYPPGTPARKEHFPLRNRIIAGISKGVVIVEARERSGALITARFALEENREVFAVPGSIFSLSSEGPHNLIREGAALVRSSADVLQELGIEYTYNKKEESSGAVEKEEEQVLAILEEPLGVDRIKEATGLDTPFIIATLSKLELRGLVKNLGEDTYQRMRK